MYDFCCEYPRLIIIDAFDSLDAQPERVTSADVPIPYAKSIEDISLPQASNVVNAIRRTLYRQK
jgi:pyruvate dehydrogenase E1 component beta subunit